MTLLLHPPRLSSLLLLTLLLALLHPLLATPQRNPHPDLPPSPNSHGPSSKRIQRDTPPSTPDDPSFPSPDARGNRRTSRPIKDAGPVDWVPTPPSFSAGKPWAFRTTPQASPASPPSTPSTPSDDPLDLEGELTPKRVGPPTIDPSLEPIDAPLTPPAPSHKAQVAKGVQAKARSKTNGAAAVEDEEAAAAGGGAAVVEEEEDDFDTELQKRRVGKGKAIPASPAPAQSTLSRGRRSAWREREEQGRGRSTTKHTRRPSAPPTPFSPPPPSACPSSRRRVRRS